MKVLILIIRSRMEGKAAASDGLASDDPGPELDQVQPRSRRVVLQEDCSAESDPGGHRNGSGIRITSRRRSGSRLTSSKLCADLPVRDLHPCGVDRRLDEIHDIGCWIA